MLLDSVDAIMRKSPVVANITAVLLHFLCVYFFGASPLSSQRMGPCQFILFPPYNIINDLRIALDNFHHFGAHTIINIVKRHRGCCFVGLHRATQFNRLYNILLSYPTDYDCSLIKHLRAFGAGADEDAGKAEHGGFFGEGAAVGEDAEGVHLEVVVVEEAEGFELLDQGVKLEAALFDLLPDYGDGSSR